MNVRDGGYLSLKNANWIEEKFAICKHVMAQVERTGDGMLLKLSVYMHSLYTHHHQPSNIIVRIFGLPTLTVHHGTTCSGIQSYYSTNQFAVSMPNGKHKCDPSDKNDNVLVHS